MTNDCKLALIRDIAAGEIEPEIAKQVMLFDKLISERKNPFPLFDGVPVTFFITDDAGELSKEDKIIMDLCDNLPERYRVFPMIIFS